MSAGADVHGRSCGSVAYARVCRLDDPDYPVGIIVEAPAADFGGENEAPPEILLSPEASWTVARAIGSILGLLCRRCHLIDLNTEPGSLCRGCGHDLSEEEPS